MIKDIVKDLTQLVLNIIEQMSLCKYEFVILELKSTREKIKLLLGIIHKNKLQVSKDVNMKGKIRYFIRKCRSIYS